MRQDVPDGKVVEALARLAWTWQAADGDGTDGPVETAGIVPERVIEPRCARAAAASGDGQAGAHGAEQRGAVPARTAIRWPARQRWAREGPGCQRSAGWHIALSMAHIICAQANGASLNACTAGCDRMPARLRQRVGPLAGLAKPDAADQLLDRQHTLQFAPAQIGLASRVPVTRCA
ncbi:hypothetical protein XbrCFBP1976_11665 [Xanthomonas bromi]|uniref:Uncharacterized protein n=1 Tax=Xanthomonas bromi TaxID=56449 RepID=A0ABX5BS80_9XANT|nr:hypothetical protein XbrCFBP1976_11665 [Xanthomonas bromi]